MRRTEPETTGNNPYREGNGLQALYIIKFSNDVLTREARLEK
jgi:hypothetical protein